MNSRRGLLQTLLAVAAGAGSAKAAGSQPKILHRQPLADEFKHLEATFVEVTFPLGAGSPRHRHPGFVLGYVIEGRFRFAVGDEPEKILKPGDVFYEPPGAVHRVSANGGDQTAKVLAIVIAEPGSALTEVL